MAEGRVTLLVPSMPRKMRQEVQDTLGSGPRFSPKQCYLSTVLQVGKFSEMGRETHTELIFGAVFVFPQCFSMPCRVALLGKRR